MVYVLQGTKSKMVDNNKSLNMDVSLVKITKCIVENDENYGIV
jgi:hypothetical protein